MRDAPTPLIQCIEYDWALCFQCRVCGHKAAWGALELVKRFRDRLRIDVGAVNAAARHCGQQPHFNLRQGGGMMLWDGDLSHALRDPFAFRDRRLRAFLADQGLPLELADERKAAADAWVAAINAGKGVK